MNTKSKPRKFNFLDIIIILVVVVIAGSLLFVYYLKNKKVAINETKLTYVLELVDNPIGFSELIKINDNLVDGIKNFPMGKVIAIETAPEIRIVNDLANSEIIESSVPNREKVLLTIEASVVDTGEEILVGGSYDLRVGKYVNAKGNGYAGTGFILQVERKE